MLPEPIEGIGVHSGREAADDFDRRIPGIARAFVHELTGAVPLWIRALTFRGSLPRNYFTTAPKDGRHPVSVLRDVLIQAGIPEDRIDHDSFDKAQLE